MAKSNAHKQLMEIDPEELRPANKNILGSMAKAPAKKPEKSDRTEKLKNLRKI